MNYDVLRTELTTDPTGLGYAEHIEAGSDNRIAELLNAPRGIRYVAVGMGDVLIWSAQTGALRKLTAAKSHPSETVAVVAETALALLTAPLEQIDLGRAEVRQMFDVLVAGGVFTAIERDQLLAMAQRPSSRAQDLGLGAVSDVDVAIALRG